MSKTHNSRGFTLIELMVVIAIIAVLAAVVAPQVFKQVEKGRIDSVLAFYNSVKTAANSYFADTGSWPAMSGGGCNNDGSGGWANCNTANPGLVNGTSGSAGWDGPYLDRWPANPWGGVLMSMKTHILPVLIQPRIMKETYSCLYHLRLRKG